VDQILLYYSRSQAPAWERNVLEALPLALSSVRQAELLSWVRVATVFATGRG
jgi:hypothetical protein